MNSLTIVTVIFLTLTALSAFGADGSKVRIETGDTTKVFISDGRIVSVLKAGEDAKDGKPVLICEKADYVCNERTGKCGVAKAK